MLQVQVLFKVYLNSRELLKASRNSAYSNRRFISTNQP